VKRRGLIVSLSGAMLAAGFAGRAQTGKLHRIGWLTVGPLAPSPVWDAFVEGMRERGWVEGRDYTVDNLASGGRNERFAELAAELVRRKVDLIVCGASPQVAAAKRATTTIPIVFYFIGDPVGSGFVASLARPGGNATGLGGLGEGIFAKQFDLLKEVVPKATRIAKLYHPEFPFHAAAGVEVDAAARARGVTLVAIELRSPDDINTAFMAIERERVDAVHVFQQAFLFGSHGARVVKLAIERRLPAIASFEGLARDGLLMSYGTTLVDDIRRLPHFIDRILKGGAKPADLPVEQPARFHLTINLKTARAIGVTIPASLRLRADEVIE
jgi:putative ABC transport system substrate-binding protein